MTLIVRALALLEGFAAYPSALTQPPIPVTRSPPQVATSAAALRTASDGRHGQGVRADRSGASHSRSCTARRERQATENTGRAAPAHRRPRAAISGATGRSPAQTSRVVGSPNCSPKRRSASRLNPQLWHKPFILRGISGTSRECRSTFKQQASAALAPSLPGLMLQSIVAKRLFAKGMDARIKPGRDEVARVSPL
jgi:hypothetical protein